MLEDFRFKIRGLERVMNFEELVTAGRKTIPRCVKIIDMKQKKTWVADYRTVVEKFR